MQAVLKRLQYGLHGMLTLHIAIIVVLWFTLYKEGIEFSCLNALCSAKV